MFFTFGFWTFIALIAINFITDQGWTWFAMTCPLWIGAIADVLFFAILLAFGWRWGKK